MPSERAEDTLLRKAAIVCVESTGHVNPQIALALELAARGVICRFYIPSDKMQEHILSLHDLFEVTIYHMVEDYTDLPLDPEGEELNEFDHMMHNVQHSNIKSLFDGMPEFDGDIQNFKPDVIIYDPKASCACLSAVVQQVPCVTTQTFPGQNFIHPLMGLSKEDADRFIEAQSKSVLVNKYNNRIIEKYGHDLLSHSTLCHAVIPTGLQICTGIEEFNCELSPRSERLLKGMTCAYVGPMRNDSARIASVSTQMTNSESLVDTFPLNHIRAMKDMGKSIIYVSFGTQVTGKGWDINPSGWNGKFTYGIKHSGQKYCQTLWTRVMQAFGENEDYFVVLATVGKNVYSASEMDIPSNFYVAKLAPQLQVLKLTDVFITHAGANSTMESIIEGVPMLALPFGGDQCENARVITREGLGAHFDDPLEQANVEALQSAVTEILKNRYKHKEMCLRLKKTLQGAGGAPCAVKHILDYIRDFEGHVPVASQNFRPILFRSKSCGEEQSARSIQPLPLV